MSSESELTTKGVRVYRSTEEQLGVSMLGLRKGIWIVVREDSYGIGGWVQCC